MSDINFEKDLPAYISKQFPKLNVNAGAILQISKLLNVANDRLLDEMTKVKKKSLLHSSQAAAEKILPKYMLRLAKSEAIRQLALYEIGILEYSAPAMNGKPEGRRTSTAKPRKSVVEKSAETKKGKKPTKKKSSAPKEKRKKVAVSPYTAFKVGISKLHSLSHSYLHIEKDGGQYLSSCLYYFMKAFAAKMSLLDLKHQAGPVEMRQVLTEFLGPNVFKSAISEGNKCLMLHENDLIKFDPRDIHKHDPRLFSSPLDTHSFRPGIHFLLHYRFARPFAAVDNSSEYVEHVLLEVARLFATELGGNCTRAKVEFMDENDIKCVMEDILPGELRKHAIARATKALADYVAETSELYHSSISTMNEGFPGFSRRKSAPKPAKRPKTETKPRS